MTKDLWPLVPLGDVVVNRDSVRVPLKKSDRERRDGTYPYYGASGIIDHIDSYLFEGPHVLVGEDGANLLTRSTAIAFIADGKFWVNNHAHVLAASDTIDLRYLVSFLETVDLKPYVTGTAQPKLTRRALDQIPIPLPPLPEQRRIADILDKADAIRRKRKQAIALTEDLLRSTFLDMFGDPVTNPKGWDVAVVEELCNNIVDCPHTTPKYGGGVRPHPCVRTSDLQRGFFDWSTTKYVGLEEYTQRIARLTPVAGDVFYTREGERYGIAAILPEGVSACLGQRMMLLRPDTTVTTSQFLWALMNSEAVYRLATAEVGGSTSPHVNVKSIRRFRVVRPPIALQLEYARVYDVVVRSRIRAEASLQESNTLFSSLVSRAFSGGLKGVSTC